MSQIEWGDRVMNTNDHIIDDMRESGISEAFLEELETFVVLKEIG